MFYYWRTVELSRARYLSCKGSPKGHSSPLVFHAEILRPENARSRRSWNARGRGDAFHSFAAQRKARI